MNAAQSLDTINILTNEWHAAPEIKEYIKNSSDRSSIIEAASLRTFFRNALFSPEYKPDARWPSAVSPSTSGISMLKQANVEYDKDSAAIAMSMFCLFHHHTLFINPGACNLDTIREILNHELSTGKLRLPHRFGLSLYNKFNDTYKGDRTDHLIPSEAWQLLEGMDQGVYQVGRYISGPLGLIEVEHRRYIPPSRAVVLWHCSDPGCEATHSMILMPFEEEITRITTLVRKKLTDDLGPASEWPAALSNFIGEDIPTEPYTYFDIPCLLADCVTGGELIAITRQSLGGARAKHIRQLLSSLKTNAPIITKGSADEIARSLKVEHQLQLLFSLPNKDLAELIDQGVFNNLIDVPLAELRRSFNRPPSLSGIPRCEISKLGVRCSSEEPLEDLGALIWSAYSSLNKETELNWRLKNRSGAPTRSALLAYLCNESPKNAVKELILPSQEITAYICEKVRISSERAADGDADHLLWKIGFDIPKFSDTIPLLRRRLDVFYQELLAVRSPAAETDREKIRSAGVNLFVSIEAFLEIALCYNVWLLASDHFTKTKFSYDPSSAKTKVTEILGSEITSGEGTLYWSTEKTNTLGVVTAYISSAVKWMASLSTINKASLVRADVDMPHFANSNFRAFPLRHNQFWADCDQTALEKMIGDFKEIATQIARSNLANIRNGLDHHRTPANFPQLAEMFTFVAQFREAVDKLEAGNLFPCELWLNEIKQDRFGRIEYTFINYSGRTQITFGPSFALGLPDIKLDVPLIIAPNLLGVPNAELYLKLREKSTHTEYWCNYPRRRKLPSPHKRT